MLLFLILGVGEFQGTEIAVGQAGDLLGQARVRDGDTLVVSGTPVRLQGLHCPELSEAGGAQAGAVLGRMVAGQQVSCTLNGGRTYDRLVGRCYVGGTDLAAARILGGFCARCPEYDPLMRYLPAQMQVGGWRGSMRATARAPAPSIWSPVGTLCQTEPSQLLVKRRTGRRARSPSDAAHVACPR